MRWILTPFAMLSLASTAAFAHGTGGGNEFFTHQYPAFDFQVASPDDWSCDGCTAQTGATWTMTPLAQPDLTNLHVSFMDGDKAVDLPGLKAELDPTVTWYDIQPTDRGGFVGFSSSPLGQDAPAATEYYLVTEHRVIRIDWAKDPAGNHTGSALELDAVKGSINRVSEPPRVNWIKTESDQPYKVGDLACLLIGVSDLRATLSEASLRSLDVEGNLPHWSFIKSLTWDKQGSQFKVCYQVTPVFGPTGLRVRHMSVEIPEDGRGVDCDASIQDPTTLTCTSLILFNNQSINRNVTQKIAPVATTAPDLSGPVIHGLTMDVDHLQLTIDASANAGLGSAEIFGSDDKSRIVYPDEIGTRIPLGSLVHEGWNTIDHVVLYDTNGVPLLLRRPGGGNPRKKIDVNETYEAVTWLGQATPTTIKVVTFLKGGGGPK